VSFTSRTITKEKIYNSKKREVTEFPEIST